MSEPSLCPCGRPLRFERCCGPYLRGEAFPQTAEDLMRSRYTAYARREIDYLIDTHLPHDEARRSGIVAWSERAAFVGLEVLQTEAGQLEDETGVVEFIAHTQEGGREQHHRERSRFLKKGGRWYFIDGDAGIPATAPGLARVGRNEPCPCGSGKKYKKCCGG